MAWPAVESVLRNYRIMFLEAPLSSFLSSICGPYCIFFGWIGQAESYRDKLIVTTIPLFYGGGLLYIIFYQERLFQAIFRKRRSSWLWTTRLIQAVSLAGGLVGYVELGRRLRPYSPLVHFGGKSLLSLGYLANVFWLESLIPAVPGWVPPELPPPPKG